jgi:hypothetical protein
MQVLFAGNQPVSELFMIREGQFHLSKNILVYSRGPAKKPIRKDILVTTVHPGEFLGASQALEGRSYEYTCTCGSTTGEALVISKKNFVAFMVSEGKSENLLAQEKHIEEYMQKQVAATLQTKIPKAVSHIIEDFIGRGLVRRSSGALNRQNSRDFLSPLGKNSRERQFASIDPAQRAKNVLKSRGGIGSKLNQSMSLPHISRGRDD